MSAGAGAAAAVLGHPALRAFVDRIVPEDGSPGGWEAGAPEFLARVLGGERADAAPSALEGLDALQAEAARSGRPFALLPEAQQDRVVARFLDGDGGAPPTAAAGLRLLADLVLQGFWGDPGNGGNRHGASWSAIGYRPRPDGASWPDLPEQEAPVVAWDRVRPAYDAVVVGAGAGGGVAACVLAEAGLSVLLVERGRWLQPSALPHDHLRSQRLSLGYQTLADPPAAAHPRVVQTADGLEALLMTDPRWGANASTVGGGTRVYGAQAWRFAPEDFRMATVYGVPEGSSLADWPIAYEDLEPDYDRAEWELGVAGDATGDGSAGPRRRGYPMPPFPLAADADRLRTGAERAGLTTTAVPLLINTAPYNGRGACIRCGACVGFGCPGEFKTDTRNTAIPRAVATGRCDVLVEAQATRIRTDADGRVTGVVIAREHDGAVQERQVAAADVLLGAGATETARLLLASATEAEPAGLGNGHDQVGRHLQSHVYAGTWAVFDEPVQQSVGPGPGIATTDHRHRNPGVVGGAMLANDFVPTPLSVLRAAVDLGLVTAWGAESKQGMRDLFPRLMLVMGPVQEVPDPESRVTLDPDVRDALGMRVARLTGGVHPEDLRTAAFVADRAVEWATASGARVVRPVVHLPDAGPSRGQHQAGTCRMGDDPRTSVTDAWGAVWGHDNLRVVDASLHVTNGGVNPVLTVLALAYRVSARLAALRTGARPPDPA